MGNIYLLGFMGAGKSTVGLSLAEFLGWKFIDTDSLIVKSEGMPVSEIFRINGEPYFRDLETACLEQSALLEDNIVSTGGGIIERPANREIIASSGTSIFLDTDWDTILQRISQGSDRPLAVQDNAWESTAQLYNERLPFYRTADLVIETRNKSVSHIVNEIAEGLNFKNGIN